MVQLLRVCSTTAIATTSLTHGCDSRPQSQNKQMQVIAKCSFYDYRLDSNKELKLYNLPPPTYNAMGAPTYRLDVVAERQPPSPPPAMPPPPPQPTTVAAERQPAARI